MGRGRIGAVVNRLAPLVGLGLPMVAGAGELSSFHDMVADAYAPYRSALFYLRTGNPGVATLELDAAGEVWKDVIERFAKNPPDAFSDGARFGESLISIRSAFDDGIAAVECDDPEAAVRMLGPVSEALLSPRAARVRSAG